MQLGIGIGIGVNRVVGDAGAPSFDPDYQAWLDEAATQGFTLPSAAHQTVQNQFILDLKSGTVNGSNVWAKLDHLNLFANDNDDLAVLDMVGLRIGSLVGSPTFTADQGIAGDGTSGVYVDMNFTPNVDATNYTQDDAAAGYYQRVAATSSTFATTRQASGTNRLFLTYNRSGLNRNQLSVNDTGANFANNVAGTSGVLYVGQRTNSTTITYWEDNSNIDSDTQTSTGLPDSSILTCHTSDEQISMHFFSSTLTANEIEDFNAALETLLAAL